MAEKSKKKEQQQGVVGGPAPFLTKTYEMVGDPLIDDVISWTETGENFVVWKPDEFARDLLPKQFKHNNFSSFVRQLNTYGFRKVVSERWEFSNGNFRKGEQRLLSKIQRRKPTTATIKSPPSSSSKEEEHSSTSTNSASSPNHHHHQQQQLILLSEENQKLKNENRLLVSELSQAKNHSDALIEMLSNYVDVVQIDGKVLKRKPLATEDERKEGKGQGVVKIFGVCVAGGENLDEEKQLKRGRCDKNSCSDQGHPAKKMMDCSASTNWM